MNAIPNCTRSQSTQKPKTMLKDLPFFILYITAKPSDIKIRFHIVKMSILERNVKAGDLKPRLGKNNARLVKTLVVFFTNIKEDFIIVSGIPTRNE